jgi:hypothetical protein
MGGAPEVTGGAIQSDSGGAGGEGASGVGASGAATGGAPEATGGAMQSDSGGAGGEGASDVGEGGAGLESGGTSGGVTGATGGVGTGGVPGSGGTQQSNLSCAICTADEECEAGEACSDGLCVTSGPVLTECCLRASDGSITTEICFLQRGDLVPSRPEGEVVVGLECFGTGCPTSYAEEDCDSFSWLFFPSEVCEGSAFRSACVGDKDGTKYCTDYCETDADCAASPVPMTCLHGCMDYSMNNQCWPTDSSVTVMCE